MHSLNQKATDCPFHYQPVKNKFALVTKLEKFLIQIMLLKYAILSDKKEMQKQVIESVQNIFFA